MNKQRDIWVDNVKVIACVLVVLGHFFQSMVKANILVDGALYEWFNTTIYYFHVPLFFICSGYLFQKYSKVDSLYEWKNNILRKLLALGIPYLVFSVLTWLLKTVFASSVNDNIGGLGETLFLKPASPYWYLYILFFIFVVTKTAKNKNEMMILLCLASFLKLMSILGVSANIYIIDKILDDWIWFVLGMYQAYENMPEIINKRIKISLGSVLGAVFMLLSIVVYIYGIEKLYVRFVLGVVACVAVMLLMQGFFEEDQNRIFGFMAKYTMPIFLMHTMVAAPFRSILLKLGITNLGIHIVLGLIVSFVGPIIAILIIEKIGKLDFIIYPTKYIKVRK